MKECVFAAPVIIDADRIVLVTQNSSVGIFSTKSLQLLLLIKIKPASVFVRAPEIVDSLLFVQDASGQLLVLEGLCADIVSFPEELNSYEDDCRKYAPRAFCLLRISAQTFGGAFIVSGSEKMIHRALIGSRDDRLRCFCFLTNGKLIASTH